MPLSPRLSAKRAPSAAGNLASLTNATRNEPRRSRRGSESKQALAELKIVHIREITAGIFKVWRRTVLRQVAFDEAIVKAGEGSASAEDLECIERVVEARQTIADQRRVKFQKQKAAAARVKAGSTNAEEVKYAEQMRRKAERLKNQSARTGRQ